LIHSNAKRRICKWQNTGSFRLQFAGCKNAAVCIPRIGSSVGTRLRRVVPGWRRLRPNRPQSVRETGTPIIIGAKLHKQSRRVAAGPVWPVQNRLCSQKWDNFLLAKNTRRMLYCNNLRGINRLIVRKN
jgi:hypothetical protein